MLPLPMYSYPHHAPMNLATCMPSFSLPTDLGPKTYVAYGCIEVGQRLTHSLKGENLVGSHTRFGVLQGFTHALHDRSGVWIGFLSGRLVRWVAN